MPDYEKLHRARLKRYERQIAKIYAQTCDEAARLGASLPTPDDGIFSFDNFPRTRDMVDKLLADVYSGVHAVIVDGVRGEWDLSNRKNDALCDSLLEEEMRKAVYYRRNDEALQSFIERKVNGLNLSERVWQYTSGFKNEIELGLDCGIREGLDAPAMARRLKQYLQHPDKLFRRVRDEHGTLQLSKAAQAYHPGRGVYRSSYKNARRLAVTETNIAYATADHERWKQLDFIKGIEIRLSNNHTCLGRDGVAHPFFDICDELQGVYPKEFKFTGWHPHCRCIAVPILPDEDEFMEYQDAVLDGKEEQWEPEGEITELPNNFTDWLSDNEERIANAASKPYFLRDNEALIRPRGGDDGKDDSTSNIEPPRLTAKEIAEARHAARTLDDIRRIQDAWDERVYGKEYVDNIHAIEQALGIKRSSLMTEDEADLSKENPNRGTDVAYSINCQTCTFVHELRRRGFNVFAKGDFNDAVDKLLVRLGISWKERFKTISGSGLNYDYTNSWAQRKGYGRMTEKRVKEYLKEKLVDDGRYEVYCAWRGGGAHVFRAEVKGGVIHYSDPQTGEVDASDSFRAADPRWVGVARIDNALIDIGFLERVEKY